MALQLPTCGLGQITYLLCASGSFIYRMRMIITGFLLGSKELIPATHLEHRKCLINVSYFYFCFLEWRISEPDGNKASIRAWHLRQHSVSLLLLSLQNSPLTHWGQGLPRAPNVYMCCDPAQEELDWDWWVLIPNSCTSKLDGFRLAYLSHGRNWGQKVRVKTCHSGLSPLNGKKEDRGVISVDF